MENQNAITISIIVLIIVFPATISNRRLIMMINFGMEWFYGAIKDWLRWLLQFYQSARVCIYHKAYSSHANEMAFSK